MKRIGIIGSGNVGANSAFFMAENGTATVTLVDIREGLSEGKALDLLEAGPIRRYDTGIRGSADITAIRGSDIVVLAAGRVRSPGEGREALYRDNAPLVGELCREIRALAPGAVVINVVEPVDMLTLLAGRVLGFDRGRVLGVGGLLSSTRLRHLVSRALGVSPREVTGMVIGPHRPGMVVLEDTVRVSGVPVAQLLEPEALCAIVEETRRAGDTILELSERSTAYYAPSAAVAALARAVIRDGRTILPVSMRLDGEYGLRDIALSVPARIGAGGAESVIEVALGGREEKEFRDAAGDLRRSLERAGAGAGPGE